MYIEVIILAIILALDTIAIVILFVKLSRLKSRPITDSESRTTFLASSYSIRKLKKRYLVFSIISEGNVNKDRIQTSILRAMSKLYGEPFAYAAQPTLIFYDEGRKLGILRVRRESYSQLMASLHIAGKDEEPRILFVPMKTTGSVKKAREIIERLKPDP